MVDPDCFLRQPLPGEDPASDLAPHLRLLGEFIPGPCMPTCYSDGDLLVCRFDDWVFLDGFLCEIAAHALGHPSMIPYLTKFIDWQVTLNIAIDRNVDDPFMGPCNVRPTLRLRPAAVVALALTVAYSHWFDYGEDRSTLIPR